MFKKLSFSRFWGFLWEILNHINPKIDSFKSTFKVCRRLKLFVKSMLVIGFQCQYNCLMKKESFQCQCIGTTEIFIFNTDQQHVSKLSQMSQPFRLVVGSDFKTKQEDYINWISPKRIIAASSECWLRPAAFACCDGEGFHEKNKFSEEYRWRYWGEDVREKQLKGKSRGIQDPVWEMYS